MEVHFTYIFMARGYWCVLQNQILLDRLEGMHIVAAESERKASAVSVSESGETSEGQGESDLQNVIRYLRRSIETVSHRKVE